MKRVVKHQGRLYKKQRHQTRTQVQQRQQRRLLPQRHLIKGSLVEVTSDEEGFKGAWFLATILKLPSSSQRNPNVGKFYVEYKSLVSDDDSSRPLREYVSSALVRPVPPIDKHRDPFQIGDLVDAYYSDGWWTGVITKLLHGPRFIVTFQNPPDVIEFGPSDLRFHREWVNGSWVPPANQRAAELMFSVGKRVEVSLDYGGCLDVWFPATVLEDKGNDLFLVQCHKDEGSRGSSDVKEIVDSVHIRPCPPHLKGKKFYLLEKVDAFHASGWWSGVITKELPDSRYVVFFKHTKMESEFVFSELRPHMEWKGGKWFTASQDVSLSVDDKFDGGFVNKSVSSIEMAVPHASSVSNKSASVEKVPLSTTSRANDIELPSPCNDEPLENDSSPRQEILDSPDFIGKEALEGETRTVAPSTVTYAYNDALREQKILHTASPDSVNLENNFLGQALVADQLDRSHPLFKRMKRKRAKFGGKEEIAVFGKRKSGERKVQVKKSRNSVGGKEASEGENGAEEVPRVCPTVESNLPVVLGLACDNISCSGSKQSSRSNAEETVKRIREWGSFDETELHSVKVTNQFEVINGSQKKRRGRPPKSMAKASTTTMFDVHVATSTKASTMGHVLGINGRSEMLPGDQITPENQSGTMNAVSTLRIGSESAVEASTKQRERQPTKRGKKRTINLNLISQVHDAVSPDSAEGKTADASCTTEELERAVDGSPPNALENQPLSKWFGDLHSPTAIDSSRSSLGRSIAEASEHAVTKEGPAVVDEARAVGSELHNLPFEKKSMLWSAIESMEVFQKLPQKPHFWPLQHFKESQREGLAIGFMVTFAGVVERISKLQFDDTKGSIDDILETLLELEAQGFDVGLLRDRVNDLGRVKERRENLEEEAKKVNNEMAERELEMSRIDNEVEEINKQIKVLQGKLSEAVSVKQIKNGEIELLQVKMNDIKEKVRSIRCEFGGEDSWP